VKPVAPTDLAAAIVEFERELLAFGLVLPPGGVVADGEIHRIHDAQHLRSRNYDGWYVLRLLRSGLVTGWYGSWWRDRGTKKWSSRNHRTFTAADRLAIAEQRAKTEADRLRHHEEGGRRAARMWMAAKPCSSHPYLQRKQVPSHGLRVDRRGRLLISVNDLDGNLRGLQWIDADGKKRYTLGSDRERATCFVIGNLNNADNVAVVEGYATGATVHEATGWPVVVAFDAGGVEKIAKVLRQRLPAATLVFAGDNDPEEKDCRGQQAARRAARRAGGVAALPPTEGHDWNDHAAAYGLKDVRARVIVAAGIVDLPSTVTLADGVAQVEGVIREFFSSAQAWHDLPEEQRPAPSADLVIATMGVGKTRMAREAAGQFLERSAAATVGFALPLHRLTAEQAAAFENEIGHNAAIWRGMDQPDPNRDDGAKMCLQPELSKAAQDAGASMSPICAVCPSRNECGYRKQRAQKAHAWYFPHQLIFRTRPTAVPPLAVLVIDEKFHDAGMVQNIRLSASTLEGDLLDVPHAGDRALLGELRGILRAALKAAVATVFTDKARARITKADLEAAGLTADLAHEAQTIEWSRKPKPVLSGDVSDMLQSMQAMAGRFTGNLPRLWRLVAELLRSEHGVSTSIEIQPDAKLQGSDGLGLVIWMHHRLDVNASWRCPTLVLDGTAKPESVRQFFPDLHVAPEVHIEAPHQQVTWVRASFTKWGLVAREDASEHLNNWRRNNIEDLQRFIEVKAADYRGRGAGPCNVLVVTNKDIEELLLAGHGLPGNVATEHFNNLRGTNDYERVRAVIVIGRPLPDERTIRRQAERRAGHPLDQTDPLVAAVRWSICEAELLQVIARARGIRRTEANPLDVLVLGDVPLPLKIDQMASWDQAKPHPRELMAARGVVPDCGTDTKGFWDLVVAILPDLFRSKQAAWDAGRSRWDTSMRKISIDKSQRERWQSLRGKPHGGRYSIPVLVDPPRRRDLEVMLELMEPEKQTRRSAVDVPQGRRRQAPPACDLIFKAALDPVPFPGDWQACQGTAEAPPARFEGDDSLTACCVPVALPEALGSVGEALDYLVEAQPGPVPVSLDGDPSPDPLMGEALTWLSDQIRLRGISPFKSFEPIDPTLSPEETINRRMQAEWRDRLAWHQARHDLASDVAVRP
jgi:putative DNA primase/helicase